MKYPFRLTQIFAELQHILVHDGATGLKPAFPPFLRRITAKYSTARSSPPAKEVNGESFLGNA
jgi:hypothetical protein